MGLSLPSPYSAMTQGECVSALARAWKLTGDGTFAEGARRALDLMCRPVESGGPAIVKGKRLFLEEVPSLPRSSILNGWIFGIFGLYDFWLAFKDENARELLHAFVGHPERPPLRIRRGLLVLLRCAGHLASHFYHDLHIHQLTALAMIDNDTLVAEFAIAGLDTNRVGKIGLGRLMLR